MNDWKEAFGKKMLIAIIAIVTSSTAFVGLAGNVAADQGTEDSWGYYWTDSNSPSPTVSYNWIDITGTGTSSGMTGDDQSSGPFNIGFDFNFYGNTYTQLYFDTNGILTFGTGTTDYGNDPIPSVLTPNNYIAPYWDDLVVGIGVGYVYYQTIGVAPNEQLVVEYYNVRRFGYTDLMTFEVILNETGQIWFQYNSLSTYTGSGATVGIENSAGTTGSQYSYNLASLTNGLAIMFDIMPLAFGPDQEQVASPGDVITYTLMLGNNLGASDSFDIAYVRDLGWPVGLYDGSMNPLTDSNGNGVPDTGDVPAHSSYTILVTITIPLNPTGESETTTLTATSFNDNSLNEDAILTSRVLPAHFEPPQEANALDDDSDSLFEYISVNASVNVTFPGFYIIDAFLFSQVRQSLYLDAGLNVVELLIPGYTVYQSFTNGPYFITLLLYDDEFVLLDSDMVSTAAYTWNQFEITPYFDPPHSHYAVDLDSDGLYDYLVVNVSVNITVAGIYWLQGNLQDSTLTSLQYIQVHQFFNSGNQIVQLWFPGGQINTSAADGTFTVDLRLYNSVGNMIDSDTYVTGSYIASEFEGMKASLSAPITDDVVDLDGDGLFDYLFVNVTVLVTAPGNYNVSGLIWNNGLMSVLAWNNTALSAGSQVVTLRFSGADLNNSKINGPYYVWINLFEQQDLWLDSTFYWTSAYNWASFESPMETTAVLSGTMGEDDWYVTQVSVTLSATGGAGGIAHSYYRIDGGSLTTYTGAFVISADGLHTLEYYSTDNQANVEPTNYLSFKIDATDPVTTASVNNQYNVTLSASDAMSGLNYTRYRIDDGAWLNYTTNFTVATSGFHHVDFYSVDNASNVEVIKTLWLGDSTAPTTSIILTGTAGQNGWFTSNVTVTFSASDSQSGINRTMYLIGTGSWQKYNGTLIISSDGNTTFQFYSVDNGGNSESTHTTHIKVDKVAPATTSSVTGSTVTLSASDDTSGVNRTLYRIDSGNWQTYSSAFVVSGSGNHTVEFYTVDMAGNSETTKSIIVNNGAGILSSDLLLIIGIIAVIVAAMLVLFFVLKRRKKDESQPPLSPPPMMMQQTPPPAPPAQPPVPPQTPYAPYIPPPPKR